MVPLHATVVTRATPPVYRPKRKPLAVLCDPLFRTGRNRSAETSHAGSRRNDHPQFPAVRAWFNFNQFPIRPFHLCTALKRPCTNQIID